MRNVFIRNPQLAVWQKGTTGNKSATAQLSVGAARLVVLMLLDRPIGRT
jgi:hypothetical protein